MTNPLIIARDAFLARHPETRITLDGRSWGLIDTGGTGPALVFLPGTLGRGDVFFRQIEALAPHRRVLALSYPDSGGVVEWSASLPRLLDTLGIDQTAVLGSSLGGYLAQYLAATRPERISHLFAANTLHDTTLSRARAPYTSDVWNAPIDTLRGGFAAAMGAWQAAHPQQADMVELLLAEVAGRIPDAELRARLDAIKSGPALPPLGAVRATVIESLDDPLIPPTTRAAVRARLAPQAVFRFGWGGHFPYLLRPELYANVLLARLGHAPLSDAWTPGDEALIA